MTYHSMFYYLCSIIYSINIPMLQIEDGFSGERSIVLPEIIRKMCEDDNFLKLLFITDIGYYPSVTYHYRERQNGAGQYILIYCVNGSGWYKVYDRRYDVKKNQWFIIPKGAPHVYASNNNDPWTIYWIHFTGDEAPVFGDNCYVPSDIYPGSTSRIKDRNDIFEEIFLTLSDNYSLDNLRYASALLNTYLASFRFLNHFRKYNPKQTRIDTTDVVSMAVRYMNECLESRLTLDELARYIGYSPSQFSLIFRNGTGHSPLNYFNILKVQRACQLLETTNLKINQICVKVGIDDCYYFSRLFTKIVGISPKKYRSATSSNIVQ